MHILVWMNAGLASITIFRFIMYTFSLEMNTRTKLSPAAWKDPSVQEVAYEWTRALRMFFGFRLIATFAVCYGGDVDTNWLFLIGTLLFNLYFLLYIFGVTGPGLDGGKIVQPEHTNVPKIITIVHFLGSLFCFAYYLFVFQPG